VSGRAPVLSVTELRPIAQSVKTDQRLTYRAFRAVSIRLTWALLHTDVTPNQVTVVSLLVAGAGLVLAGADAPGVALAGSALLLLYHLLDRVDGEVARARQHFSLVGVYLDNAGHYVTGAGVLVAAGFRLAAGSSQPRWVLLLGVVGGLAAAMARVEKHAAFHLHSQYVLEQPTLLETLGDGTGRLTREAAKTGRTGVGGRRDAVTLVRDVLLTVTAFPQTVALLAVVVVLDEVAGHTAALGLFAGVVGVHVLAWAGVEVANLSQNLAAELRRLSSSTDD
jgi:phosphatidylglycerophosphate synthase